jgi:hypothetical protein
VYKRKSANLPCWRMHYRSRWWGRPTRYLLIDPETQPNLFRMLFSNSLHLRYWRIQRGLQLLHMFALYPKSDVQCRIYDYLLVHITSLKRLDILQWKLVWGLRKNYQTNLIFIHISIHYMTQTLTTIKNASMKKKLTYNIDHHWIQCSRSHIYNLSMNKSQP